MSALKLYLLRLVGYEVSRESKVGACLMWNVEQVRLGKGSRIGAFTVIRDLRLIELKDGAVIGTWNWISASLAFPAEVSPRMLALGRGASLTTRHYVDTTGGITLGDNSSVAGRRCTLLTHGVDFMRSIQTADPIAIGADSRVSGNCTVLAGTTIEERVIVNPGALIDGRLKSDGIYAAGQARRVRDVEAGFFTRNVGFISTEAGLTSAGPAAQTNLADDSHDS